MSITLARRVPVAALVVTSADTVRGIILITASYALMSLGDALVKFALPAAGIAAAVLFRGVIGSAGVIGLSARQGYSGLARLWPHRWGLVILRSLLQCAVAITWFAAWTTMTLADSYAVGFTTPLVATLLAVMFIGERLDWTRIISTSIGLVGVLIMLRPGSGLWSPTLVLLLAGVLLSAFSRIITRQLARTETAECLAVSLLLMHLPVGAALLFVMPIPGMTVAAFTALVVLGLITGFAQLLNARAYLLAPVSALAPFDYSSMLWAVILGWLCFGEMPHLSAMQGAVVIAAAGLYSFHTERTRRRVESA